MRAEINEEETYIVLTLLKLVLRKTIKLINPVAFGKFFL